MELALRPEVPCPRAEGRPPILTVTSPEFHLLHALLYPADGYSTVDRRERRTLGSDSIGDSSEKELLKPDLGRKAPPPGPSRPSVRLVDAVGDAKPQPVDSWV